MIGESELGRWLAPLCVLLIAVAGCSSSAQVDAADSPVTTAAVTGAPETVAVGPASTVAEGPIIDADPGWLVWVHDREPPDLHFDDSANGTEIAAWIRQGLLEGLFGVDHSISFYPELLAGEPTLTENSNGTVRVEYQLRDGLRWSDDEPITSDDVAYTHRILVEGCEVESDGSIVDSTDAGCEYQMSNRIGYELVTSFEVIDEKHFAVSFASFFAGWRGLYSEIYAEHAFGADAFEVNQHLRRWETGAGILPSSGPLILERWEPGQSLRLRRNERYHGSVSPDALNPGLLQVEGVHIAFIADPQTLVEVLSSGDAHVVMSGAEADWAELVGSPSFTVATGAGPVFEHWGLNLLNRHLAKPEVREAIAYSVDKQQMVTEIFGPLLGSAGLPPDGLGNSYLLPSQTGYVDHQEKYQGNNVDAAASALSAAGYARGPDGVWAHPVDGRLSLRAGTTAGNVLRDRALEMGRDQLARAGIEIVINSAPGGLFYSDGPFAEEALEASATGGARGDPSLWDIAQFPWSTGAWPGSVTGFYLTGSNSNPYGFTNPEFDVAAADCDAVTNDSERNGCYNDLDTFATTLDHGDDGLFVIPISQRPHFYGYVSAALDSVGVAPDLPGGGPLVNVVDFALAG